MQHARFFSVTVALAVLGFGALGFWGLPAATFQGDLTRMALLPESAFGWTRPQPAIDSGQLQQSAMHEADVLVVGDSFSDTRLWQSVLTGQGLKVRTENWTSLRALCADFMPWARSRGFKGRHLVIQVVERNAESVLDQSLACQQTHYTRDAKADASRSPPPVSFDPRQGNYLGKLSSGVRVQWNALRYEYQRQSADFERWPLHKEVQIARVPHGCALFSHQRCMDSLFLTLDKAEDLGPGVLEKIAAVNARLTGVTPVWAVVPNRSTAYLYTHKQFWNAAEQRFAAPNLLRMTQCAIADKVVDLYPANNTHLSTAGHLMMGREILQALQTPRVVLPCRAAARSPVAIK